MKTGYEIDWQKLRQRISGGPIYPKTPPKKEIKKPSTPEEIETFRAKERARNKEYRDKNPEKVHAREKEWRKNNPEKVKAKKARFYEKHKTDPVWLEAKRKRQREYKLRKKLEKLKLQTEQETIK